MILTEAILKVNQGQSLDMCLEHNLPIVRVSEVLLRTVEEV